MNPTDYNTHVSRAFSSIPNRTLYALARNLITAKKEGHTVFTCGNGGSAANANHLAQDLSKGTRMDNRVDILRAVSLCANVGALTAWANDDGYEWVFFQQLVALGQPGDILIAISGSGNSANVLRAVQGAHAREMRTWGICGFDGGHLLGLAHRCVHVPCDEMGMVEAVHGILFHWLVDAVRGGWDDTRNEAGVWCPGVEP